jgi:hypothetical protein
MVNKSASTSVWRVEPWKMLKRSSSMSLLSVVVELEVRDSRREGVLAELGRSWVVVVDWLIELERSCAVARTAELGRRRNSSDFNWNSVGVSCDSGNVNCEFNSMGCFDGEATGGEDFKVSRLGFGGCNEISNSSIWSP